MTGIDIIAAERKRQIEEEGFTKENDNKYTKGELAHAAVCYTLPSHTAVKLPYLWPWDSSWWKPTPDDRIRELAKAGALIAAEIDRLQNE